MITRFLIVVALLLILGTVAVSWMTGVTGSKGSKALPELDYEGEQIEENLREYVKELSFNIGQRSVSKRGSLPRSAKTIRTVLESFRYEVQTQEYRVRNFKAENLIAEKRGLMVPKEVIIVGAHYDSPRRSPGANDNASGSAVLLELARLLQDEQLRRTVRFVFFTNGERPYRGTASMGSKKYVEELAQGDETVILALCLDSVGYYSLEEGSQRFPFPMSSSYPTRGDFLAFFGTPGAKREVQALVLSWLNISPVPVQGAALPWWFPGMIRADHESFAEAGLPAVVLTDTGSYRWEDSGTQYDRHSYLSYDVMAHVTLGLSELVQRISRAGL